MEWTGRNPELSPRPVSSTFTDGDSEEEQCKSCSHFSHGGVYRQHLQAPIAPSIPPHSAQVDTWSSCPGADPPRTRGLSPTAGPGFPVSLQQYALVQVQGAPTNQWNAETLHTVLCLISSRREIQSVLFFRFLKEQFSYSIHSPIKQLRTCFKTNKKYLTALKNGSIQLVSCNASL